VHNQIAESRKETLGGLPSATHKSTAILDLLRALMALWVLVHHGVYMVDVSIPFIDNAGYGVDVFMMISGFLMVYQFRRGQAFEPWESPKTWLRFYIRRFFRIAPLYYLALIVALRGTAFDVKNVLLHLSFLFGLFPKYCSNNQLPDWSLTLEMQFYAVFPFLMLFIRRFGYVMLTVVAGLLAIYWPYFWEIYVPTTPKPLGFYPQPSFLVLKLSCFVAGMLIAEAQHHLRSKPHRSVVAFVLAFALSCINQFWIFPILAGITAIFVTARRGEQTGFIFEVFQRICSSRPVVFSAEISYGVYLFHSLVLLPIAVFLMRHGMEHAQPFYRVGLLFALAFPIIFALAWLLYRYIEQPGIKLGKWIASKIRY
jgi:peptidoglycan/LPS O-acetylase OafA/YrhL